MTKSPLAMLVAVLLAGAGCGSTKSPADAAAGGTGGTDAATDATDGSKVANVMVSGIALPHALSQMLDPTASFTNLQVSVVDPSAELAGLPALASAALVTTDCTGDGGAFVGCPWSFASVNIGNITLGLVVVLQDLRTTAPVWVRTGTGNGTAAFIMAAAASKTAITGRQAFAVSRTTQAALATLASAALTTTITGDDLQARGYMIGHVTGKLSAGAPPVAGAMVTAGGTVASAVDIIYPNQTFTGVGPSTAAHGIFLVVPKAAAMPTAHVTTWTVVPPTAATDTWPVYIAGTQPGAAFVIILLANE
jgi:hypothetical protein